MFILFLYLIRECWKHQALINFFLSRMLNTQSLCKVEFNSLMQLTTRHVDCEGNRNYISAYCHIASVFYPENHA